MILIAYSRAKARIVLATSCPRNVIGNAAELLGQLEVLADQALGGRVDPGEVFGRDLDVDGVPGGVEPVGDPGRLAQERRRVGAAAGDADHDAVGRRQRELVGLGAAVAAIDQVGDLRQGDLAEPGQVRRREEVLERRADPLGRVDLAGVEPLDQVFDRDVDVDDLVGLGQDAVGDALLDP